MTRPIPLVSITQVKLVGLASGRQKFRRHASMTAMILCGTLAHDTSRS